MASGAFGLKTAVFSITCKGPWDLTRTSPTHRTTKRLHMPRSRLKSPVWSPKGRPIQTEQSADRSILKSAMI